MVSNGVLKCFRSPRNVTLSPIRRTPKTKSPRAWPKFWLRQIYRQRYKMVWCPKIDRGIRSRSVGLGVDVSRKTKTCPILQTTFTNCLMSWVLLGHLTFWLTPFQNMVHRYCWACWLVNCIPSKIYWITGISVHYLKIETVRSKRNAKSIFHDWIFKWMVAASHLPKIRPWTSNMTPLHSY